MSQASEPSCQVLYIDDDEGLGLLVRKTLEPLGYGVALAPSGAAGLALTAARSFDVVALDHHMPGEVGIDVLKQLLAAPGAPPVIYVTGSDDVQVAVAALKAGAGDYLFKDTHGNFRELLPDVIEGVLETRRLRDARRADQEEMRAARTRAEALLAEVNHRVANSLQLVASLIGMQRRAIDEGVGDPKTALADAQARITAIGQVHRRLYSSSDVSRVELRGYLKGLVEELGASLRAGGRDFPILFQGVDLDVKPDTAVSIGVIVTELLTNAYKYAYPDGRSGEIRVALKMSDTGPRLLVEDDGIGKSGKSGTGLGMRIVDSMCKALGGDCLFDATDKGFRADVSFKNQEKPRPPLGRETVAAGQ